MHYCRRDSHATSRTAIYANITQTGRIWIYCSWFWVVLVGFVGFVGGFGWFWVVLLVVLGGFGWFWVVLGGFGWFHVLVTTLTNHDILLNLAQQLLVLVSQADCRFRLWFLVKRPNTADMKEGSIFRSMMEMICGI